MEWRSRHDRRECIDSGHRQEDDSNDHEGGSSGRSHGSLFRLRYGGFRRENNTMTVLTGILVELKLERRFWLLAFGGGAAAAAIPYVPDAYVTIGGVSDCIGNRWS